MHTYKDLGSIKSSTNKTSESIKSEFTCCSISFARALVIGPILISLGLFTIGSSVYVGGATIVGMSSSFSLVSLPFSFYFCVPYQKYQKYLLLLWVPMKTTSCVTSLVTTTVTLSALLLLHLPLQHLLMKLNLLC